MIKAICLGDPVVDLLGITSKDCLEELGLTEGGCVALNKENFRSLITSLPRDKPLKR